MTRNGFQTHLTTFADHPSLRSLSGPRRRISAGASTLAHLLNFTANWRARSPDVQDAAVDAVRRIVKAGKPAGFLSVDEKFADRLIEAGALFVAKDIDMAALKRGLKSRL